MENNQNTPNRPQRKKVPAADLILIALGILVFMRVEWSNMNSFHYLILFMYILCLMLRWANMRKTAARQQTRERYKAEIEAERAKKMSAQIESEATEVPAEEAAPVEAPAAEVAEEAPAEEKTEE